MKNFTFISLLLISSIFAEELKVKASSFHASEKDGVSVFEGKVNVIKSKDELNASKVTIYSDKENKPTKFIAQGKASFSIITKDGTPYKGKAEKVIYLPAKKEYHFYKNVHLKQINNKKEIIGDEVILKTIDGTAYAKGAKSEPVIMIFDISKKEKK